MIDFKENTILILISFPFQPSFLFNRSLVRSNNGGHPRHRGSDEGGAGQGAAGGRGAGNARGRRLNLVENCKQTMCM